MRVYSLPSNTLGIPSMASSTSMFAERGGGGPQKTANVFFTKQLCEVTAEIKGECIPLWQSSTACLRKQPDPQTSRVQMNTKTELKNECQANRLFFYFTFLTNPYLLDSWQKTEQMIKYKIGPILISNSLSRGGPDNLLSWTDPSCYTCSVIPP